MNIDYSQCFLTEGVLNLACWLTRHWESNTSRKVSRLMICHWQRQVSCFFSSSLLCLPLSLSGPSSLYFFFSEDDPFWLPLYGNICCRLVAQPLCMIQPVISGQLKVKVTKSPDVIHWYIFFQILHHIFIRCVTSLPALSQLGQGLNGWQSVYGVLRGQSLLCFQNEEALESEDKPLLVIPIKKVGPKWT